jgi:mannonate dehydratase
MTAIGAVWLEDPVAELQKGFRIVRQHATTPLAVGEAFNSVWAAHLLIGEQWLAYIRMTVVHGGGITPLKKITTLAEIYHVRTGCHGATDLSPVALAAALHFDISVSNSGIQKSMWHTREIDDVFPHAYHFKDGYLHPGEATGSSIDDDEKLAGKFPYQGRTCP